MMTGYRALVLLIASVFLACTSPQGDDLRQKPNPEPSQAKFDSPVQQDALVPQPEIRLHQKPTPTGSAGSAADLEGLLRQLPAAILDKSKLIQLLPPEASLKAAMKCTDKNPLVAVRTRTVSAMDKNVESARKRVGLGIVTYGGFDTVKVQRITEGEVDKGCSALKNIEVQILKLKMNFIAKNGAQKTSFGRMNVIRIGAGPWHVLKM